LLYPNPPRTKVQIQGFFASLRMTKFDGGYSNPEFALGPEARDITAQPAGLGLEQTGMEGLKARHIGAQ
jgi:hypothetical protein